VNPSHRIVTRTMGMTCALRFADAVAARHAGDPGAWLRCAVRTTGVARVLLRRRAIVATTPTTLTIAPRIELRLATSRARAEDERRSANDRVAHVARELPRTVSAPSAVPMLQRASRRAVRDDAQASGLGAQLRRDPLSRAAAAADRIPTGAASAAPARVLRRRAPAVAAAPAPLHDEPHVRAMVQPPRPVPLSPVEINRLTDHIVQTIDRRIAAFRERRGRV
jgi:hypothetical protein